MPGAGNPQAYDRYTYSSNNPIKYIDPSGHRNCEEDGYCPDKFAPAPLMTVAKATEDYSYTNTYNNTVNTTNPANQTTFPCQQNNPITSHSFTGYATVGNTQIPLLPDSYEENRHGSSVMDLVPIFSDLLNPYANSKLVKSSQPNVAVTVNYTISSGNSNLLFMNPCTYFGVSGIGINNSSGLPLTLRSIYLEGDYGEYKSTRYGLTSFSQYNNYSVGINVYGFQYTDIYISMYSSSDFNEQDYGIRMINARFYINGGIGNIDN